MCRTEAVMPDEIVPHLFLGGEADSMEGRDYALVVNCTKDLAFHDSLTHDQRIRIPVNDLPSECDRMLWHVFDTGALAEIASAIEGGGDVLVHCAMGMQRSPAVVAMYLMSACGMSRQEAIEMVMSKRRVAFEGQFSKANFAKALERHEANL